MFLKHFWPHTSPQSSENSESGIVSISPRGSGNTKIRLHNPSLVQTFLKKLTCTSFRNKRNCSKNNLRSRSTTVIFLRSPHHFLTCFEAFRDVKLILDCLDHGLLSNHAPCRFLKIISTENFRLYIILNLHNFLPKLLLNVSKVTEYRLQWPQNVSRSDHNVWKISQSCSSTSCWYWNNLVCFETTYKLDFSKMMVQGEVVEPYWGVSWTPLWSAVYAALWVFWGL